MRYIDYDFVGDLDKRKFIIGYLFMFNNCTISWKAPLQPVVALLSSTKVEFVVVTKVVKEFIWLKGILNEFWLDQKIL